MPKFYCPRGDCGKPFPSISNLDDHVRMHDNNLTNCHYCQWKGQNNSKLFDHINHHFHIRPFKCSFCDASFYTTADRKHHETSIHEKIPNRYKCEECPFTTHSKTLCNQHKAKIHH